MDFNPLHEGIVMGDLSSQKKTRTWLKRDSGIRKVF